MTNKEKQDWLKDRYPLTIITDRYSGTYSGGYYLAFPLDFDEIPSAVNDSDPECAQFWKDYKEPIGKGSSVQAAIDDLIYKMHKQTESEDERIRVRDFMMKQFFRPISPDLADALADAIIKVNKIALNKKQKEQKHPNGCFTCDEYKKGYEAGRLNGFTAGYNKAMKEQKPAEWSEKHIAGIFEKVGLAKIVREQGNDDLTNALQDAMLELSKVGNIEWSEEDEEMIERLIRHTQKEFDELCNDRYGHQEIISDLKESCLERMNWLENRLKSLRPQPKQEKSDYITPHKQFFKWIYDRLVSVHKENPDADYMISFKKRIEELSFDNPSWEPSEDEERLIKTSISFLKDFADKGYENAVECIDWLKAKLNGNTCK